MKIVIENKLQNEILYTGDLEELDSLIDLDGKVNNDKLIDFLLTSNNITHTTNSLKIVKKTARKRKIEKIEKEIDES